MFGKLLDAGLNVLRLNFSHGDQEGHGAVLDRFRKVGNQGIEDSIGRYIYTICFLLPM